MRILTWAGSVGLITTGRSSSVNLMKNAGFVSPRLSRAEGAAARVEGRREEGGLNVHTEMDGVLKGHLDPSTPLPRQSTHKGAGHPDSFLFNCTERHSPHRDRESQAQRPNGVPANLAPLAHIGPLLAVHHLLVLEAQARDALAAHSDQPLRPLCPLVQKCGRERGEVRREGGNNRDQRWNESPVGEPRRKRMLRRKKTKPKPKPPLDHPCNRRACSRRPPSFLNSEMRQ